MIARLLLASTLCGAAACSPDQPDGASGPENQARAAEPAKVASPRTEPEIRPAAAPARSAAAAVRRCGWLFNPTPANWWLTDRDGQWILGSQGADQAPGMDEMPDMSVAGWEETNGHYGHGCACMTITADPATGRVLRIADARPKPLAQCRADRALPAP